MSVLPRALVASLGLFLLAGCAGDPGSGPASTTSTVPATVTAPEEFTGTDGLVMPGTPKLVSPPGSLRTDDQVVEAAFPGMSGPPVECFRDKVDVDLLNALRADPTDSVFGDVEHVRARQLASWAAGCLSPGDAALVLGALASQDPEYAPFETVASCVDSDLKVNPHPGRYALVLTDTVTGGSQRSTHPGAFAARLQLEDTGVTRCVRRTVQVEDSAPDERPWITLSPGTCVRSIPETTDVATVPVVPCDTIHEAEMIGVGSSEDPEGSCLGVLANYGTPEQVAGYQVGWLQRLADPNQPTDENTFQRPFPTTDVNDVLGRPRASPTPEVDPSLPPTCFAITDGTTTVSVTAP